MNPPRLLQRTLLFERARPVHHARLGGESGRRPYAEIADPQTLNLYGYVRNIPTSLVDGDGHSMGALTNEGFEGFESFWERLAPGPSERNQQQQNQQQQQAPNQADAGKPPQPSPTGPDGKPTTPPVPVPGAPEGTGWKWNPDPQNSARRHVGTG